EERDMAYREDNDLVFLQYSDNEDLAVLVDFLTKDKDGNERLTEELSRQERFKNCNGDFTKVWNLIAGEIQCYGADSIITMFRGGKGVVYKEILTDVCKKMKVRF
ncbi:MAG: DUF3944 domain-containing protein, partial [Thermodesulfobacteriota bacterium]